MIDEQRLIEARAQAAEGFRRLATSAVAERGTLPTPCPLWTAADVVHHVGSLEVDTHPLRALDVAPEAVQVVEFAVHSWDLACALGVVVALPGTVIRAGLEVLEPLAADLGHLGCFGYGPVGAPETTDLQTWLLHLAGRRPSALL